jgi:ketosteroid isomerase-like protein
VVSLVTGCANNSTGPTQEDRTSLIKTTAAIRDAFARGDVPAIVALHHPDVIKYFGGSNVVIGREALAKGLTQTFQHVRMEFVGNDVESTVFNGQTAIETSIFSIKVIPKSGAAPTISRGRAMVVYIKYKDSPYGWVSLREMAQAAP